jgi:hypothetical protein
VYWLSDLAHPKLIFNADTIVLTLELLERLNSCGGDIDEVSAYVGANWAPSAAKSRLSNT